MHHVSYATLVTHLVGPGWSLPVLTRHRWLPGSSLKPASTRASQIMSLAGANSVGWVPIGGRSSQEVVELAMNLGPWSRDRKRVAQWER